MEYRCKLISVFKLEASYKGFVLPICSKCKTGDCTNPLELRDICILGERKKMKVYVKGDDVSFVINCEGFSI
jgi:hypothetical protein